VTKTRRSKKIILCEEPNILHLADCDVPVLFDDLISMINYNDIIYWLNCLEKYFLPGTNKKSMAVFNDNVPNLDII